MTQPQHQPENSQPGNQPENSGGQEVPARQYHVALLIERELVATDADQVLALHVGVEDPVVYHLILPVENSSMVLSASMAALASGQLIPVSEPEALSDMQSQLEADGRVELENSARLLTERGQTVTTRLTAEDPIVTLREVATAIPCDEIIVLTEPHVVREFLHLDWTSRARRELDIPTLHLIEHTTHEDQP